MERNKTATISNPAYLSDFVDWYFPRTVGIEKFEGFTDLCLHVVWREVLHQGAELAEVDQTVSCKV